MYLVDPMRDRIVPIALLTLGALLYIRFYVLRYHLGLLGVSQISVAFGVIVMIETAALVAVAFLAAVMFEISFGRIGLAILKFAAVVSLCDGLAVCVHWRVSSPASPRGMIGGGQTASFAISFVVFIFLFAYLFQLNVRDSGGFVTLLGMLYTLFRFILVLNVTRLVIVVGGRVPITLVGPPPPAWMVNVQRGRPRPPPPPPIAPAVPPPVAPTAPGPSSVPQQTPGQLVK
jgi:hypothetical protein